MLVAAPYGGSIAVTRNPKKLVKVQGVNKPMIYLYTSSGKLTAKFQVNVQSHSYISIAKLFSSLQS